MKQILLLTLALLVAPACGDGAAPVTVLENGEACSADNPDEVCESDLCLEEFGDGVDVDEGLCTEECVWNEDASDTCADGEICLNYRPSNEFFCFEDCTTDADCRTEDGWSCLCLDFFCLEAACIPDLDDEESAREVDPTTHILELYDSATTAKAKL